MITANPKSLNARIKFPDIEDGCWEWQGYVGTNGYGFMAVRPYGTQPAHRLVYETFVGEIPHGLQIDHLCRNKRCVNPKHLEPVTRSENMLRAPIKSRYKTHCKHGHEYSEANTIYRKDRGSGTQRDCRACAKQRLIKFHAKKGSTNED